MDKEFWGKHWSLKAWCLYLQHHSYYPYDSIFFLHRGTINNGYHNHSCTKSLWSSQRCHWFSNLFRSVQYLFFFCDISITNYMRIENWSACILCIIYVKYAQRSEEWIWSSGIGVTDNSEVSCECWEKLNPRPLEEQSVLFIAKPSLCPLNILYIKLPLHLIGE